MFRWCSFCQKFLGESEPKTDYTPTHGICHNCKDTPYDADSMTKAKAMRDFFKELLEIPRNFRKINMEELVQEGKSLNARPSDIFVGIFQTVLQEITVDEKNGKKPYFNSDEFNKFIDKTSDYIKKVYNLDPLPAGKPLDVLLTLANGNYNYPAARFMEIMLTNESFTIMTPPKVLSMIEIFNTSLEHQPKIIAITVQDPSNLEQILSETKILQTLPYKPLIIFGGAGTNFRSDIPKNITAYDGNMELLLNVIRNHVAKTLATV